MSTPSRSLSYAWLAIGVLSVGAAAILIRKAESPALVVSFWRTLVGGVALFLVVTALKRPLPRGTHLKRALAAGALLGAHFWLWIELREHTPRLAMLGIVVALVGTIPIALDSPSSTAAPTAALVGDALALAGAIAIALYVIVGRRREKDGPPVDVLAYSSLVSLVASVTLLVPLLVFAPSLTPATNIAWGWVIALALGPQLIGHTALNAALARLPASIVSGAILGEPVIATALAWAVLDEKPGTLTIAGSAVTLVGLAMLLRAR